MFLAIRREGQTVSRMQEVAGEQVERVLAVDEHGNESWVPPDRLGGQAAAQKVLEVEVEVQPIRRRPAPTRGALEVEVQPQTTTPENTTTENSNDTEAVNILPQEPASFWATFGGCSVFFCGSFLFVSWFVVGPSIWIGLLFNSPNFGPVVSILGALLWIVSYPIYLRRVYWPGRPWVPVLDSEGRPKLREVAGQQWVYAQKECGLPRIWKKSWVPREAFPVAEEGDSEQN